VILPDVNVLVYAHREDTAPWHRGIFRRLCVEVGTKGNFVPDAYLAVLAIESGCEWITADRDYSRFGGLRWRHPPRIARRGVSRLTRLTRSYVGAFYILWATGMVWISQYPQRERSPCWRNGRRILPFADGLS
jgi:hypothetical protein